MFGFCSTGSHAKYDGTGCPGSYRPFWIETVKGKSVVKYQEEDRVCDCTCHKKGKK